MKLGENYYLIENYSNSKLDSSLELMSYGTKIRFKRKLKQLWVDSELNKYINEFILLDILGNELIYLKLNLDIIESMFQQLSWLYISGQSFCINNIDMYTTIYPKISMLCYLSNDDNILNIEFKSQFNSIILQFDIDIVEDFLEKFFFFYLSEVDTDRYEHFFNLF